MAGKLILLKASIDSIPIFWFGMYSIPSATLHEIEKIRRNFLWGSSADKKKIHRLKWGEICKPRQDGGLGLVPLRTRNTALLAKWWWKCYHDRNKLWNEVLKNHHGPQIQYNLAGVVNRSNCSDIFKSFQSIHSIDSAVALIFRLCFKWKVRNGRTTYFWEDFLCLDGPLQLKFPSIYKVCFLKHVSVKEFCDRWKSEEVGKLFNLNF